MINLPFNVKQASAETIVKLMVMGILEVREDGLHVSDEVPISGNVPKEKGQI